MTVAIKAAKSDKDRSRDQQGARKATTRRAQLELWVEEAELVCASRGERCREVYVFFARITRPCHAFYLAPFATL